MLKYIIATIVVIGVWVAWFFLAEVPEFIWVPALVTLLVVLVLVAIWVARRIRARRAARELEKALAAQAAEQARSARPDMQGEILQMQREFQSAIAALKGSKLARGGENALYALPWHLIVGPPGAGKSTALRNSGLQFPYASGGVKGLGGTRNCDWWLTNEAVLLDTAGRWTTEEEDRDEWIAFLDLVKKHRPLKPLNGIVAAIGLDQLGGAHEEEVNLLARRMRERIDEVQNRLEMSLPVYVLFTKVDLVPGFVETFTDLSKMDRGQVWGFTVPLANPPSDPGYHFSERFEELNGIVERRALRRMGEERKIESRELIHSFPQQLGAMKKNCTDLISQLFEASVYGETPMFRGVYFSSGTQEGRPIDRVMHKMAEAFGIRSEANLGEPVTEAKSYFLRDVFLNVVFPDRDVALRSAGEQKRQRRNTYLAAAALAVTALLLLLLPGIAAAKNMSFLSDTEGVVDTVAAAAIERPDVPCPTETDPRRTCPGPLQPSAIRPLRQRVEEVHNYDSDTPPLMSFLMYPTGVYRPLNDYYTSLLRSGVVGPIVDTDELAMEEFGRRHQANETSAPTGAEHSDMYDRLKMYLLTTRPVEDGEPHLDEAEHQREWLAERIQRRWYEMLGGEEQVDEATNEEMGRQALLFAELLGAEDALVREDPTSVPPEASLRFPRSEDNVERLREVLNRVQVSDMALDRLIALIEPLDYDLTLANLVGTVPPMEAVTYNNASEREEARIRGAFTRRAWDTHVREMLYGEEGTDNVFSEPWVLGRADDQDEVDSAEQARRLQTLRNRFIHRYIVEWRDFIRTVTVASPEDNNAALVELQDLTRGSPEPYRLFFQQVSYNTYISLPEEESSALTEAASETFFDVVRRRLMRIRASRFVVQVIGDEPMSDDEVDSADLTPDHVFATFEAFTRVGAVPEFEQPEPTEDQPAPPMPQVPLAAYEEQLHAVRDALQAHRDNPEESNEPVMAALQAARTTTLALIASQQIDAWRPRLDALLMPPLRGTADSVARGEAGEAGASWCNEVYLPYYRNIRNNYPMNPAGHDVSLEDFGAFYLPEEGTLWAFYGENLDRRIPKDGDSFIFATNVGQPSSQAYRPDVLQYLERAGDITNVFFPPGAEGPTVVFDARILPSPRIATQEFCLGGVCVEHHNGPERWRRYTWPGDSPEEGASLEIRGESGVHERIEQSGEWGFFRLLEQGTVTSQSNGNRVFTMVWRLRDHQADVSMEFRPIRGDAPFFGVLGRERNPPLLQPLRARDVDPPPVIASGAHTCNVH